MGARGKPCPLCSGDAELLRQVNALLESGAGPTEVSKITSVQKDRIARHKKHTFQPDVVPTAPGDEMSLSDQRLHRWMQRSEDAYLASAASSDLRGLVESLRSGLRAEMEYRRRAERRDDHAVADDLSPDQKPVTVAFLDDCIRKTREADKARGFVPCPLCSFGSLSPKTIAERLPLLKVETNEHSGNPH